MKGREQQGALSLNRKLTWSVHSFFCSEALGKSLEETEEMLTPGDMPAGRVVHPIRDALLLIAKLRRQIESMQNDFEKLTSRQS